jgi:hypothetical protein
MASSRLSIQPSQSSPLVMAVHRPSWHDLGLNLALWIWSLQVFVHLGFEQPHVRDDAWG